MEGSRSPDAARYYGEVTGRRVSIEHALIRDINDQGLAGRPPARCCTGAGTAGPRQPDSTSIPHRAASDDAGPKPVEREFVRRVRAKGVSCTVRDTRGVRLPPRADSWPPKAEGSGQWLAWDAATAQNHVAG